MEGILSKAIDVDAKQTCSLIMFTRPNNLFEKT